MVNTSLDINAAGDASERARIRDLRKQIAIERGSDNDVLLSSEDRDILAAAKMYSRALGIASKKPKHSVQRKHMVKGLSPCARGNLS